MPFVSEQDECELAGHSPEACKVYVRRRAEIYARSKHDCEALFPDLRTNVECTTFCTIQSGDDVLTCVGDFRDLREAERVRHQEKINLMGSLALSGAIVFVLAFFGFRALRKRDE